jgi:hypothetical protein
MVESNRDVGFLHTGCISGETLYMFYGGNRGCCESMQSLSSSAATFMQIVKEKLSSKPQVRNPHKKRFAF